MSLTRYGFKDAISAFFEFPTDNAKRILPRGIEPVEPHHGTSIFAVTVFDFDDSEVGAYGEVVYAVIVPPLVAPERSLPQAAFFPWQVATTTKAARRHAIERWHLPHWMEDVEVDLERRPEGLTARVRAEGAPALEITVTPHEFEKVRQLFQSFQRDESGSYLSNIVFEGEKCEHEEETGRITLLDHPFNKDVVISEVYERPFREMWMRSGCQLFDPLVRLPG